MHRREQGLTMIELMIVVAIIAVISAIAIPNFLSDRLAANESAAIATLRAIASAQAQVQTSTVIDVNRNGQGEFGYFGELSGGVPVRDSSGAPGAQRVSPPVLSGAFSNVSNGKVQRSGYFLQLWLPDAATAGVAEAPGGGVGATAPDPGQAETLWCCYAWPVSFGNSGKRTFFVSGDGNVLTTRNTTAPYSGDAAGPAFGAAYVRAAMIATTAANASGSDGRFWTVIR